MRTIFCFFLIAAGSLAFANEKKSFSCKWNNSNEYTGTLTFTAPGEVYWQDGKWPEISSYGKVTGYGKDGNYYDMVESKPFKMFVSLELGFYRTEGYMGIGCCGGYNYYYCK